MRTSFIIATFGMALGVVAMCPVESHAQDADNYRYCGFHTSSATECYFNSRAQCRIVGLGCIDNPGYIGDPDARAQASVGRYRKAHS